ncbi:MAG: outer membrane protein assembly factor BamB family protein [Acidimicrobiales bacterium]
MPAVSNQSWATTPTWSDTLPDVNEPIALSSPTLANLDGSPAAVVGDRRGYVYGVNLSNGKEAPGWPVTDGSAPVDSSPSVTPEPNGRSIVLFGSGNDANPVDGGYQAFGPNGAFKWFTPVVNPPTDAAPASGVEAGMSVGSLQGGPDAVAGSLGQLTYALNVAHGSTLTGWPYFNSDSTHSTAALADLYGNGQLETIVGGDQSAGAGQGQQYSNGGHLRILSPQGNLICSATTNQVVDSSPAVGGFLPGGATGIVTGTGSYFPGASETNTLRAYDTHCKLRWSTTLDGSTGSSPALADIAGNGTLEVVEGTDTGTSGSVWVLNATTGTPIWHQTGLPRVIGSVVTADLFGLGHQDVIVPTVNGTYIFDGVTGAQLDVLDPYLGLQNSPLVTEDPNGTVGITLAGYVATGTPSVLMGRIDHFEIPMSNGALAVGPGSWPMFHHDPQLTGNAGGITPMGSVPACDIPAASGVGYDIFASDGGVFAFGGAPFCGSTGGIHLNAPVVGVAESRSTGGVLGSGVRRRNLRLRTGRLLRFDGWSPPEQPHRGDGGDTGREGVLGSVVRRRSLRLWGRPLLRIDGRPAPGRTDCGYLPIDQWRRVPAGRLRRRDLRLRLCPVLGIDGGPAVERTRCGPGQRHQYRWVLGSGRRRGRVQLRRGTVLRVDRKPFSQCTHRGHGGDSRR